MSSQLLKNMTIFNFAHILDANLHPGEKQLCHNFIRIGQVFIELRPSENWNFIHNIGLDIKSLFAQ